MKIQVTHYGEPNDPSPDSNTEKWIGDHGNVLTTSSCALTAVAALQLGVSHGALLKIVFSSKIIFFRTYDDTAPEDNPRVDLFNPFCSLPPYLPDFADVSVV